jgi:hypothetical protein
MAVITVLAITAYRMAYRNSKMNDLKQDVASISQQLGKVYSNQRYTDEGVVLGEDKTFENLFVDTKMFKSSTTPFGGAYELSAISNDMFELKVTGVETEDCKYIISDDAITKKFPQITMSCEDIAGTDHYSNNNPNIPTLSPEILDLIANHSRAQLYQMCLNNRDTESCTALANHEEAMESDFYVSCAFANIKEGCLGSVTMEAELSNEHHTSVGCQKYPEECKSLVESGEATSANAAFWACRIGSTKGCELLGEKDDATKGQINYGCAMSDSPDVCQVLVDHPNATEGDFYVACANAGTKDGCLGSIAIDPEFSNQHHTGVGCQKYPEECKELVESGEAKSTYAAEQACRYAGSIAACEMLPDREDVTKSQLYMGCGTSDSAKVCQSLADHPNATEGDYYVACANAGTKDGCLGSVLTNSGEANQHHTAVGCSKYPSECADIVRNGETTNPYAAQEACRYDKSPDVCAMVNP